MKPIGNFRHTEIFMDDTYLELEDGWVIHRYRHIEGQWSAGARHKHIDDARCTDANSINSVYAYLDHDEENGWTCMVCGKTAPPQVIGMQELVQYGNQCENKEIQ